MCQKALKIVHQVYWVTAQSNKVEVVSVCAHLVTPGEYTYTNLPICMQHMILSRLSYFSSLVYVTTICVGLHAQGIYRKTPSPSNKASLKAALDRG